MHSTYNQDINLQIWADPNGPDRIGDTSFLSPSNIRIIIDTEDVTPSYIYFLNIIISNSDTDTVKEAYLNGVASLLNFMSKLGVYRDETKDQMRLAQELATQTDWAKSPISQLGSKDVGWRGILHPINYLKNMPFIGPVSLKAVIDHYATINSSSSLKIQSLKYLRIEQGLDTDLERIPDTVGGRVTFTVETVYRHPLSEDIDAVNDRLRLLTSNLDRLRVSYLEPTSERIARIERDTSGALAALTNEIEQVKNIVRNIG